MNKAQIKAELRRSACEDSLPNFRVHSDAYDCALEYCERKLIVREHPFNLRDDIRTFFLIVAEAL